MSEAGTGRPDSFTGTATAAEQKVDELSPERRADEAVMLEVARTLLNIEHSIARAEKALVAAKANPRQTQVFFALERSIPQLKAAYKKLFQDTYFARGEGTQDSLF
jgi:hypothetical protein